MKFFKAKIAILVIVSCAGGPLLAGESFPFGSAPLKNCTWCHGTSAQGYSSAPRLAGQRRDYIEQQLLNFHNHLRDNPYSKDFMWAAAANLNPGTIHELASYLSALPPEAAHDGKRELIAAGQEIYELGIPTSNIPSCVVCHGPRAEGVRQIPRLGGLSYYYLQRRLEQWDQGYNATATPMPAIARNLSPHQIEALASYLSFIGYGSFER